MFKNSAMPDHKGASNPKPPFFSALPALVKVLLALLLVPVFFLILYYLFILRSEEQWRLIVEAPDLQVTLQVIDVDPGDIFLITYRHSVSGQDVQGAFEITGFALILPLYTAFDSFGPGLPDLTASGQVEHKEGLFYFYHTEEAREALNLFVSPLTADRLSVQDLTVDLTSLSHRPARISIYVEQSKR